MNTPLIKWTGSKRKLAETITSHFPPNIETYYEPFLGGGSVFFHLLKTSHNVKRYRLSDSNNCLIGIFKIVQNNPNELINYYKDNWTKLQKDSDYFYYVRNTYNKNKDPLSLYFLTRTCYNGAIRYNKKGDFNVALHFGRPGICPSKIKEIILFYSKLMEGKDIEFSCNSFENISPSNSRDVVYNDPPYTNSKALYFGNISLESLLSWMDNLPCSWFMNINGVNSTDNEETINIQHTGRKILPSGKSSFSRMKGININVGEYFYYRLK